MSPDFAIRIKTILLVLPTGIFYLARNRYLSVTSALIVVATISIPILYYLIVIPQPVWPNALSIITFMTLGMYCFSYLALVLKVEFPAVYAKGSEWRWTFESCAYLFCTLGAYMVVNLGMIRDLFITKQYLHGSAWIGGFISLIPFVGVVFFRVGRLISNMSKK